MKIKESALRRSIRYLILQEQVENKDIIEWFDTTQTEKNPNLVNEKKFKYSYNVNTKNIKIIHHPQKPSVTVKNPINVQKGTRHYNAILEQYENTVKNSTESKEKKEDEKNKAK